MVPMAPPYDDVKMNAPATSATGRCRLRMNRHIVGMPQAAALDGVGYFVGTGTATTVSPSIPVKSPGLHV